MYTVSMLLLCQVRDENWMKSHVASELLATQGDRCVLVAIFGDEAPLRKCGPKCARSLIWYGIHCGLVSVAGKLLAAVGDTSNPKDKKIADLQYRAFAWSMQVAMANRWPPTNHNGTRYEPKDGYRFSRIGQPLNNQGFVPVLAGVCHPVAR